MIKRDRTSPMLNPANYYCRNIELAAALTSMDMELSSIDKEEGGVIYIFPPQLNLVEMVEAYYTDTLSLSPLKVARHISMLKELDASIDNAKRDTERGG